MSLGKIYDHPFPETVYIPRGREQQDEAIPEIVNALPDQKKKKKKKKKRFPLVRFGSVQFRDSASLGQGRRLDPRIVGRSFLE